MTHRTVRLGDVVTVARQTVDPSALAERLVAHFSLPAFDTGTGPEIVRPATIKSNKLLVENPCVLVSKLNPHIRRVWRLGEKDALVRLASTEFIPIIPANEALRLDFLYYLCLSTIVQDVLTSGSNGTSSSHQRVKPEQLLNIDVPLPSLDEQQAIAQILAALDDKIRNDDRTIRACESLLTQEYLAAVQREISTVRLGDVATVTKGVSYKSEELRAGGGVLFSLKCFARDGSLAEEGLKPYDGPSKEGQRLAVGDIVVAQTDLTQDGSVVGRALRVPDGFPDNPVVASLDALIVRPRGDRIPAGFLSAALRADAFREHCRARSNGTTVLHMKSGSVEAFGLGVPSPAEIRRIDDLAKTVFALVDGLRTEKRQIADLRNALLRALFDGSRTVRLAA